ncbi:MAG: hypothetical protein HZC40_05675 [Chloroflexi bacterium]|nr:hypothetical protein [Chloroflexota bacterium]
MNQFAMWVSQSARIELKGHFEISIPRCSGNASSVARLYVISGKCQEGIAARQGLVKVSSGEPLHCPQGQV